MKANLQDLNNILFEQIERLNDDELIGEELETQIKKSKVIVTVASQIISNSQLQLDAVKYMENSVGDVSVPQVLIGNGK